MMLKKEENARKTENTGRWPRKESAWVFRSARSLWDINRAIPAMSSEKAVDFFLSFLWPPFVTRERFMMDSLLGKDARCPGKGDNVDVKE